MKELLELLEVGGGAEEISEDFALDVVHEGDEQLVGLVLVFHERVLLALGAQVHAVPQGIHVVEVLLPETVDRDEDDVALKMVEEGRILVGDLELVGGLDLLDQELGDLLRFLSRKGLRLAVDAKREGGVGPSDQLVVVR